MRTVAPSEIVPGMCLASNVGPLKVARITERVRSPWGDLFAVRFTDGSSVLIDSNYPPIEVVER